MQNVVTYNTEIEFLPSITTNKTDHHDIIEILFKVALNTLTLTLAINHCFCM